LSIAYNNSYWLSHLNRGASFAKKDDCENAIKDFTRSIDLHSKNAVAFCNRAMCKEAMGDTIGALTDYRTAIQCDRKYYITYSSLGLLLATMDSCTEALPLLNTAISKKAFNDCISEKELRFMRSKCQK
jgi:tetratricopeptide (TPR) repeat protein